MDFYKKIFRSKKLRFAILSAMRFIPARPTLKLQYRIKCGRKLHLDDPVRYTEKIQWYKLNYRDPVMRQCADKYTVRDYVTSKGLGNILNELYAVYERPEDICLADLPDSFVLKVSNGSSTNLLVEDKSVEDEAKIKAMFADFLKQSTSGAGCEWVYDDGKPVIIAEQLLKDPAKPDGTLRDYKILCFGGKVAYIICVDGRYTPEYCHVVYDAEWNKQDVIIGESSNAANYEKPETFDRMMEIAGILSADFPAARIDLYSIEGKIYFGEITYFPWSGYMHFVPDSFDFDLGSKFSLPEKNHG